MQKNFLEQLDRLIRQRPYTKDILGTFRELARLMLEIEPEVPELKLDEEAIEVKRKNGFPLFSRAQLPLDFEKGGELLREFLEDLSGRERPDREQLKELLGRTGEEPPFSHRLFSSVLAGDEKRLAGLAEETRLEQGTLVFLGIMALRPFLYAFRESFEGILADGAWGYGYCPFCGSQPDMASLDKSGKRHLHCELCGEEWVFERLKCPFCENTDQETLGYFHSDQEEGLRVDFCRKCNRYIKTVDKRVFEEPAPLELEHLATIHLDLLAHEQGFK